MLIHISLNYLSSRLSSFLDIQNNRAAVFKLRVTVKTILTYKQGLACHLKMANRSRETKLSAPQKLGQN